ncbi:MAG: SDR family NAD(P)-dependent oxidoreductase [bacterium]|nr:SDR family NAD(P)-dependent oxidoreductase [bacterium]
MPTQEVEPRESTVASRGGKLDGRVALISGGASGIGAAVARLFAAEGAAVYIADLHAQREAAESLVERIRTAGGSAASGVLDVTDEDQVEGAFEDAERRLGGVDVLVCSAGVDAHPAATTRTPMTELPPEQWDFVVDINLLGTFLCARSFARRLSRDTTSAAIVTLASLAAKKPKGGVYSVSKSGVWMLTRVLADELGPRGVRANSIAPGLIETPMLRHRTALAGGMHTVGAAPEEFYARDLAQLPLRRIGTVDEVAATALFLACDDSSYITGSILSPDGGFASNSAGG